MKYKLYTLNDPTTKEVFYVGITKLSLKERLWNHCSRKTSKKRNWNKWRKIRELKRNNTKPVILLVQGELSGKDAAEQEILLIAQYRNTLGDKLTNISPGGFFHSEESLRRLSKRMKGNQFAKGNVLTNEHKEAISKASKGKTVSAETRKKLREAKLGSKNPMFGKQLSMEHKEKMSKSLTGRKKPKTSKALSKRVIQLDLSEVAIKVWPSMKAASQALSIQNSHISEVCSGKRKTAGGYKWAIHQ